MLTQKYLHTTYISQKKSVRVIAKECHCSEQKVNYWLAKYTIPKRTIKEAIYTQKNPLGDPFLLPKKLSTEHVFLLGLGLGLFWGEGNKRNQNSIRLGNTDPELIRVFLYFLTCVFKIDKKKPRFGLQIFSDMSPEDAKNFWVKKLGVQASQFQKVVITQARAVGTYTQKTQHGVLTAYFHNTKLRDIMCEYLQSIPMLCNTQAKVAQLVERVHGKPIALCE